MIQILLTIIASLAQSKGGKIGDLVTQIVNTIGTLQMSAADLEAFAKPWLVWTNAVIDRDNAGTPPTAAEFATGLALVQAINANIESLGTGGPPVALPSPPAA